jgi:hypothetical protein
MSKRDADEDKADTERSHDEPNIAPATRREVERSEGSEAREADALQHQAKALTPNLADHTIERQTLTGRCRVGSFPEGDDCGEDRRDDASDHGGLQAIALIELHADRRADSERREHRDAGPGHGHTRALRSDGRDRPRDAAGDELTLADTGGQPTDDNNAEADHGRQPRHGCDHIEQPT